jgi:hypothetical protein
MRLQRPVITLGGPDPSKDRLTSANPEQLAFDFEAPPQKGRSLTLRPTAAHRARQEADAAAYHQGRVLLLIDAMAGKSGMLDGLTKLAKLDFLLRYPVFLKQLADSGKVRGLILDSNTSPTREEERAVESRMIRYKYGPWDDRYYVIIGALVGRSLVEYVPGHGRVALRPTEGGHAIATVLASDPAWSRTAARCAVLHKAFARTSGNALKDLIYQELPDVVDRPHRMEI